MTNIFRPIERDLSEKFGKPFEEIKRVRIKHWPECLTGSISYTEFWQRIFAELGVQLDLKDFLDYTVSFICINDDVLDIIKKIRSSGSYRLGIITNNCNEWSDYSKFELGLGTYFDVWINSSEVHLGKPDKEIYLLAAEELGLAPDECIFTDDSQKNIDGAKEAGMDAVLFSDSDDLAEELKKRGVDLL